MGLIYACMSVFIQELYVRIVCLVVAISRVVEGPALNYVLAPVL